MIYLAPMQGYTEIAFRRAWSHVFRGIDVAVSPFIPLAEGSRFRKTHLRDVLPEANNKIPVIPQVLGTDPEKFIHLGKRLADLGYETMNWNLGCPKPSVARKKRGSGLLPYPDEIRRILDQVIGVLPIDLSVKTRLGYHRAEEFFQLVDVFNDYPLQNLMIHPRIGIQMYDGGMNLKILDQTIGQIRPPVVFSGDILDLESWMALKNRFPLVSDWMLGRGVLVNPFLPDMILNPSIVPENETIRIKQQLFHESLYEEIRKKLERERSILNKMKDFWSYFSRWFVDEKAIFLRLAHQDTLAAFMKSADEVLRTQILAGLSGRSNLQVKV